MKLTKICGLQDEAMIDVAINAGARHLGFVHFEKSPRHLELHCLEKLTQYVGKRAHSWVVLAKPSTDLLLKIAQDVPSVAGMQVHGELKVETIELVRSVRPDMTFMRAYSVADVSDLPSQAEMAGYDYVLFDAKPKPEDKLPGGNGTSFNWQILQGFKTPNPWFLAGGLNPTNVVEAIEQSGTQMVDVSSGVESALGIKDAQLTQQFLSAVNTV